MNIFPIYPAYLYINTLINFEKSKLRIKEMLMKHFVLQIDTSQINNQSITIKL